MVFEHIRFLIRCGHGGTRREKITLDVHMV
jgi:hypothetical protein